MKYHLLFRSKSLLQLTTCKSDAWSYWTSVDTFEKALDLFESNKNSMEFRVIKGTELEIKVETETIITTHVNVKSRTLIDV